MVALQIRDVPDDVRDALAAQAKLQGQSLQAFLLGLVQAQARRSGNGVVLDRVAGRGPGARRRGGTRAQLGQTAAEIAAARIRRESTLSDR